MLHVAVEFGVAPRKRKETDWEIAIMRLFLASPLVILGLMLLAGVLVWMQTGRLPDRLNHLGMGQVRDHSMFLIGHALWLTMLAYPIALLYALVVWSSDKERVWRNTFLFGLASPILALLSLNIPSVYQIVAWAMD